MFSLGRGLPSPASAEACASLFGWFIGTSPRSDSSAAFMTALWLCAFAVRPAESAGTTEVSRFSCMLFLGVPGVSDYGRFDLSSR